MKTLYFLFLIACPLLLSAQVVDTATVAKEVDSLIQVSQKLTNERKFDEALQIIEQAEKQTLEAFGENHLRYANCLYRHGDILYQMRNYQEVEPIFLQIKSIRESILGKDHPDYASSLNSLGNLYKNMGRYEEAEALLLEAKNILEKVLGKENPRYANILNNLALLYHNMGRYEAAEPLHLEAKNIREKVLGKEHRDYAASLNNLANLYWFMRRYEAAEALHLEAKNIREKVLGKENPLYAASLFNLAGLFTAMGRYEEAEALHLEAKNIRERVLGKEHTDYALSLSGLAKLYDNMGRYEAAIALDLEANSIREKVLGKEDPSYGGNLNDLASLYAKMGRYETAEPLFLEAISIQEKVFGKENPEYALSLNNLAELYAKMGRYEVAEPLYLEARNIWEKVLGKENPDYALSLLGLGNLYKDMGRYEAAEPLYLEASSILEKVLGKEHSYYAESVYNLAIFYSQTHRRDLAQQRFLETGLINRTLLLKATRFLSEQELASYTQLFINNLYHIYSFTSSQTEKDTSLTADCFDQSLFYKGFLLNSANYVRHLSTSDSTAQAQFELFTSYQRRLAKEYEKPIAERKGVEELEAKANELEKELVRTVAGFGDALRQVNWKEVQNTLKADEAVVEFVHFQYYTPEATDSVLYAALVLRPGWEAPRWVSLFEAKQLEALLTAPAQKGVRQSVNDLYTTKLYDLIWHPLEASLQGVKKVYYSPSGLLHRISLTAIPVNKKKRLVDTYQLQYVSSSRDLVIPNATTDPHISAAVIYGGLQYSVDTAEVSLAYAAGSRGETFVSSFSLVPEDTLTRSRVWQDLPKSEEERARLERLLKANNITTSSFKGTEGTEESFKELGKGKASPDVIHLATHGYFFPDEKLDTAQLNEYLTGGQANYRFSDNPLLRSGLILAGGNYAWTGGKVLPGKEDGILSAYEIAQLNLSKTKLVVLSACETGLGDIQGSEGVYGMQRAFKQAGVGYLLMTLWSIPDSEETVTFMETFYKHLIQDKMPVRTAFSQTQKEMRQRNPDPYYWAGFVLIE